MSNGSRQHHTTSGGHSLSFAQNALLRTAEATSGLRAEDFVWVDNHHSMVVHLKSTKTVRYGVGIFVTVHTSTHQYSGLRLLRRLWETRHLDDHPQEFVFCQIDRRFPGGKLIPTIPATGNAYRMLIKRLVHIIVLDTCRFSGHSLSSGGATDLFVKGTPYYAIKKMCRWTSDAALLYFPSEMDVAKLAARAFDSHITK